MTWRPMTANYRSLMRVIVAVFQRETPSIVDVMSVRVGEHGALFPDDDMLSIHEQGWVPFAWRTDDKPERDDEKFPPLWDDYLTEANKR